MKNLREVQKLGYIKVCYTIEDKNKAIGNKEISWRWATDEECSRMKIKILKLTGVTVSLKPNQ